MDLESVLMFPLFLYSIKLLLHSLEPLLVLLLHLRSHGAAHLLLHLAQLVHHVLQLLLVRRGHMTLALHLLHLTHHLVHHVHVVPPTLAHALAAHHVLASAVHSPALHTPSMHLGRQNAGEGEPSYDPNNHNFPSHNSLLYGSTGKIIFTRRWLSLATKRLSPFGT
jgi:hypothetical protein